MARAFKSTLRGYSGYLENAEQEILRKLFADVIQLLGGYVPETPASSSRSFFSRRPKSPADDQPLISEVGADKTPDLSSEDTVDDAFWDLVDSIPQTEGSAADHVDFSDPAVQRLLPAAGSGEDAESLSQDFAELAQDSVRQGQIEDLQRAMSLVKSGSIVISHRDGPSFARALNSVRLVIATRLGIEDEKTAEKIAHIHDVSQAEDVDTYLALLYNFVGWFQESLMTAMIGDLP